MQAADILAPVLDINGLRVSFATPDGPVEAVKGIGITVGRGQTVAIVGESGSGKSQALMAALGLLARNGMASGSVRLQGQEILGLAEPALNQLRGKKITMIFQEPMTSLDPLFRIGTQIGEVIRHHSGLDRRAARVRALDLLRQVGIPQAERRLRSYPHQLSGGQRQRVMIAMAIANNPQVLVADEPTTALDVTVQAQILALINDLKHRLGMAIVFITHDLGLVRRFADMVYVMRAGEVVESGPVSAVMDQPAHAYTRMLLAAEPQGSKPPVPDGAPVLLAARNLSVLYRLPGGLFEPAHVVRALDDVSLTLRIGQTLGIVGESGSGKSTLGRALLRLVPASGTVCFQDRDLTRLDRAAMRPLRRALQLVFQDPFGSLSPRMSVGDIVTEGLQVHEPGINRRQRAVFAEQALAEVGLDPASRNRYPHEFSGGQRQRIAIARALILKPKLIVLDEPTSALDRSVQSDIVALLRRLQKAHGLTYLFISHDLAVVRAMSDAIIVMKDGRIVEQGATAAIIAAPQQDYTRELIAAAYLSPPQQGI